MRNFQTVAEKARKGATKVGGKLKRNVWWRGKERVGARVLGGKACKEETSASTPQGEPLKRAAVHVLLEAISGEK